MKFPLRPRNHLLPLSTSKGQGMPSFHVLFESEEFSIEYANLEYVRKLFKSDAHRAALPEFTPKLRAKWEFHSI